MVARIMRTLQSTLQVSQGAMQNRRSVPGAIEKRAGLLGMLMSFCGACVIFRNSSLRFAEHMYTELFLGVQMGMGSSAVIDADQHQHGVERYRGKRVGRHAVHFTF